MRILPALAIVLGALAPAGARAAPVAVLAGSSIAGDTEFTGAVVILADTVVVVPTGTLRLRDVNLEFLPGASLVVDGVLEITGSEAVAATLSRVTVGPAGRASVTETSTTGLGFDVAGSATFDGASVAGAGGPAAVSTDGGSVALNDVTLQGAGSFGLQANGATVTADGVRVTGAGSYGVLLTGGSFTATGLVVESAQDYGMRAAGTALDVRDATFDGHCGIFVSDGAHGTLSEITFETMEHAFTAQNAGAVTLDRVHVAGGGTGIASYSSPVRVSASTVAGTAQGILSYDAAMTVEGVRFAGNGVDLEADGAGAALAQVHGSVFDPASGVSVLNRTSSTLDATNNYWGGEPNTPGSASSQGSVAVTPWLAEPPGGV